MNHQDKSKLLYYSKGSEIGVGLETVTKAELCMVLTDIRGVTDVTVLKDRYGFVKDSKDKIELASALITQLFMRSGIKLFDESFKKDIKDFLNGLTKKYNVNPEFEVKHA